MDKEEILKYGEQVFGSKAKFLSWWGKYNNYLDAVPSKLPLEEVKKELDRIEYSNFT